jgi:hypothetical protein
VSWRISPTDWQAKRQGFSIGDEMEKRAYEKRRLDRINIHSKLTQERSESLTSELIAREIGVSAGLVRQLRKCSIPDHLLIYSAHCEDVGLVKYGYTTNVHARIATINTYCPHRVLLGATWGVRNKPKTLESKIHWALRDEHYRNEWFYFSQDQADLISNIVKEHNFNG